VNQLLYGERDDPYAAMSRLGRKLGETLAPGDVLAAVVESIAQALRVPYVAIEIDDGGPARTLAQHGTRRPVDEETIPLTYRGEIVGELVVATRAPGERFDARDRRLLEDLARQTGIAVNSVRVMEELQRSRQQLVTAREEERRRIRRDLHDGLGPTLAGIALNLDAARRLVEEDPPAAEAALVRLRRETQAAVSDIRRLVYELRPPALDELGLVGALREQAAQLSTNGFLVSVEAPEAVPRLAAATEVAAYRIALEAITNAARHADAQTCSLRVSFDGMLALEVDDDGKGLGPDCRPGVGTKSMQERAEELGGTCTIESTPSRGTHVSARLPLSAT
jgi:signal transduction histidine kinase